MWLLIEAISVLVILTIALFIHEMGHALAAISQNKNTRAEICLGSSSKENKLKLKLGRVTCYVTLALSAFCERSNREELPPATYKQRLLFLAGGPIASLAGFLVFYFMSPFVPGLAGNIVMTAAVLNFFLLVTSLIPVTYPSFLGGLPSDGLQIWNQTKENRKQRNAVKGI